MSELLETIMDSNITSSLGMDSAPRAFLSFPMGWARELYPFCQLHFKIKTSEMPEWQMTEKKEQQFQGFVSISES